MAVQCEESKVELGTDLQREQHLVINHLRTGRIRLRLLTALPVLQYSTIYWMYVTIFRLETGPLGEPLSALLPQYYLYIVVVLATAFVQHNSVLLLPMRLVGCPNSMRPSGAQEYCTVLYCRVNGLHGEHLEVLESHSTEHIYRARLWQVDRTTLLL